MRIRLLHCVLGLSCLGCDDGVLAAFEPVMAAQSSGLLDDFEDQDNRAGEDGWWYPGDDDTGPDAQMTFEPVTGREPSFYAVHLRAGPTQTYGAFLGLDLPGGVFDASPYYSLSFSARAEPALTISVSVLDAVVIHHDSSVEVSGEWQTLSLPLSTFLDEDMGVLDPSQLTHLQFWVGGAGPAFDLWIDDVWLLPPG